MRPTLFFILIAVSTLLGLPVMPTVEYSAAVFTGKVISTERVTVQNDESNKCEIWKAKIKLDKVIKQDTNLSESVFVYYEQDYVGKDGVRMAQICPGRPEFKVGETNKFFCMRRDVGDAKKALFVPEQGWITAP
jgi:hypothetical protein